MAESRIVLVTGATGHQGGAVARELLTHGFKVRAMTRHTDSDKAKELRKLGAEVVKADLDDASSLEKVTRGVWGVFAVQNTWEAGVEKEEEQGKRQAEVSKKVGVQHYVYTSVGSAHRSTGIPHFENKWRIEQRVRELAFPSFTVIRPAFFMENLLGGWFKPGIDQGKLMMALKPKTKLQMIAVADIGKYGLWAFQNPDRLDGMAFDIAGDALTMPQVAQEISRASGKKVEFAPPPIEEVRKGSEDYALMLEWFDRVGYNADIDGMARESDVTPTRFADWAKRQKW